LFEEGEVMEWLDVHYFVTVVREHSITRAARSLHISQPTLTARLKKLESELNAPLLERTWKGAELTVYGRQFLMYAVKVLDQFKEISENMIEPATLHQADSNKLILGVLRPLGPYFIAPALNLLRQKYTDIQYDVISDTANYLMQLISVGMIHLGIMPYFKPFPGLLSEPLFQEEIVLLAPKNSPLRSKIESDGWGEFLLACPFYLYSTALPFRKTTNQILSGLMGRLPDIIHDIDDTNTLLNLVAGGFGYSLLPSSYIYHAFGLKKMSREPLGNDISLIHLPDVPYDAFTFPPFHKRTLYLVYPHHWESTLPLHQIVQDILAMYQTDEAQSYVNN
jgi:DNA-binding transcriptional LysR family regulator